MASAFIPPRPSAAIRIVAPSEASSPTSPSIPSATREPLPKASPKKATPKCRNVLIHGHCKNEGKGCIYDHSDGPSQSSTAVTTPVITPSTSTVNVNAPIFVPKGPPASIVTDLTRSGSDISSAHPSDPAEVDPFQGVGDPSVEYDLSSGLSNVDLDNPITYSQEEPQPQYYASSGYMDAQEYYPAPPTFVHQPLNYHLYTQLPYLPITSTSGASSSKPATHRFFMSDSLREDLQRRSEAIYSLTPPVSARNTTVAPEKPLPEEIHAYHSLVPLEASDKERRKWFAGFSSMVYKATNRDTGEVIALRRIEGFRMMQESAFGAIEKWSRIKHPNIAALREAFTTRAFGDYSLVFAYDYYPTAQTLYNLHFTDVALPRPRNYRYAKGHNQRGSDGQSPFIDESVLWSYVIQIANAMKEVHDRGLAFRTLDVSKVIVTGKNRVRVNCCGIFDVLTYDPRHVNVEALQQEDLLAFGKLVLALCCRNVAAVNNLPKAIELVSRHYSSDMKNVVLFLISKPSPTKVIDQLLEMFGTRLLTEMNAVQHYADQLEGEMMSELENGRLVRLMSKLGFINERPDFNHELRWSETGDRYIISLFRDYVFHQVDEGRNPIVNLTHVITCLNKLDAGTDERIMLVSRDEQTCLVVSYKEIKTCIDSAFSELARPRGGIR